MCENHHAERAGCRCAGGRLRGMIQPRLLLSLAQRNSHGYELIETLTQEGNSPDPGSLYRTLRSLEDDGLVRSSWDTSNAGPARRVYELTDQGLKYLHIWAVDMRKIRQQLDDFLVEYQSFFKEVVAK